MRRPRLDEQADGIETTLVCSRRQRQKQWQHQLWERHVIVLKTATSRPLLARAIDGYHHQGASARRIYGLLHAGVVRRREHPLPLPVCSPRGWGWCMLTPTGWTESCFCVSNTVRKYKDSLIIHSNTKTFLIFTDILPCTRCHVEAGVPAYCVRLIMMTS